MVQENYKKSTITTDPSTPGMQNQSKGNCASHWVIMLTHALAIKTGKTFSLSFPMLDISCMCMLLVLDGWIDN